ncbi:unnamed protein product [Prorocentrum cordatum]|uniref:Uncharacterized protein n=1 Tax=Prorocentrum cordatum TaxID=2364126 RepID=A0ABN9RMX1_9DINO|nr:unnamed protein product [Polarella glacialis]
MARPSEASGCPAPPPPSDAESAHAGGGERAPSSAALRAAARRPGTQTSRTEARLCGERARPAGSVFHSTSSGGAAASPPQEARRDGGGRTWKRKAPPLRRGAPSVRAAQTAARDLEVCPGAAPPRPAASARHGVRPLRRLPLRRRRPPLYQARGTPLLRSTPAASQKHGVAS